MTVLRAVILSIGLWLVALPVIPVEANTQTCALLAASYNEPGITLRNAVLGHEIDLPTARAACETAIAQDRSPESLFRLSRVLLRLEVLEEARTLAVEAAEGGYPPAMAIASYMLMFGLGGPVDVERGHAFAVQADARGDATGPFYLGIAQENGLVGAPDIAAASVLYERAIENGDYLAMTRLGWLILFQNHPLGPPETAYALLERSAERGYPDAANYLASAYLNGLGAAPDLARAAYWYRQGAKRGDAVAQSEIAGMQLRGEPSGIDDSAAFSLATASADAGNGYGHHVLGHLFAAGRGTDVDLFRAAKAWQTAIDLGHDASAFDLAEALITGRGVGADFSRAISLLGEARALDASRASSLLVQIPPAELNEADLSTLRDFLDTQIETIHSDLDRLDAEICDALRGMCDGRVCSDLQDGRRAYATMDGHGWYLQSGERVDVSLIKPEALQCF